MAKTNFSNGDQLTPTFMNGLYGTGGTGGHRHSGIDADGHAAKISLPGEVSGILDQSNLPLAAYFSGGVRTKLSGGYLKWTAYTYIFSATTTYPVSITMDLETDMPWANIRQIETLFSVADGTPYGYGPTGIIQYSTGQIGWFPVIGYTVVQGTGANPHMFFLTGMSSPYPTTGDRFSVIVMHL